MEKIEENTVSAGNKLIAEYDGHKVFLEFIEKAGRIRVKMQYDSSYDWLMPVVKKVLNELQNKKIYFANQSDYGNAMEYKSLLNKIEYSLKICDITELFNAAVNTITFLNANK